MANSLQVVAVLVTMLLFLIGISSLSLSEAAATPLEEEDRFSVVVVDDDNNNKESDKNNNYYDNDLSQSSGGPSMPISFSVVENTSSIVSPLRIVPNYSHSSSSSSTVSDSDSIDSDSDSNTNANPMLRGTFLPPIPPIHPHHSGSVHYSSVMNGDNGSVKYRREINAPCDYGMLVFTVGVAQKGLPYEYDLYDEAYLWSDNAGLCILYPSYDGYQDSSKPFWTLGIDPETVTFQNLIVDPSSMHRISSRELNIVNPKTDKSIDKNKIGDYVIVARHNFYNVNYYKQLKAYINSWKTRTSNTINDDDTTTATTTITY